MGPESINRNMFPLKDTLHRTGFLSITWALIIINGIIFLFEISFPKDILGMFFYLFGLIPARYSYPRWAYIHGLVFDDYLSFLITTQTKNDSPE